MSASIDQNPIEFALETNIQSFNGAVCLRDARAVYESSGNALQVRYHEFPSWLEMGAIQAVANMLINALGGVQIQKTEIVFKLPDGSGDTGTGQFLRFNGDQGTRDVHLGLFAFEWYRQGGRHRGDAIANVRTNLQGIGAL